jgi:hypothetical protein
VVSDQAVFVQVTGGLHLAQLAEAMMQALHGLGGVGKRR